MLKHNGQAREKLNLQGDFFCISKFFLFSGFLEGGVFLEGGGGGGGKDCKQDSFQIFTSREIFC